HELDRLTNLLEEVRELDVQDVWRTAVGGLTPLPASAPGTPAQLAAYLAELNAGPDQVPPPLAFVEEVAARVEHGLAAKLRGWIDKAAERLQIVEVMRGHRAATERRRQGRQSAADRPVVRPCLLIQIESDGIDRDRCELRYWIQRHSDDWHPEPGDT